MFRLGQIRNTQAKADAAERHYEEAIQIYEAAIARRPDMTPWKEELGRTWNSLAVFHHLRNHWVAAEAAYGKALRLADGLVESDPNHPGWANFKASLLHNLASLCEANARLDEAEEKYTAALRLWQNLEARAPDDLKLIENLSSLYLNLAFLQGRRARSDMADSSNAEALRLRERLVRLDPNNTRALALLADIQQNISEVQIERGNLGEAESWINRYRPVREQLATRDRQNADWQHLLADAWRNSAVVQTRHGNLEAAAEAHRKAWEISELHLGSTGSFARARLRWAQGLKAADETFTRLAQLQKGQGDFAAAQQHGKTLVEIRAKIAGEKPDDPQPRYSLALALLELAQTSLVGKDGPAAREQALLGLLLLEQVSATDASLPVRDDQWEFVRELAGAPVESTLGQTQRRDSLRAVLARLAGQTSINTALDRQSIQWPPSLAAELRRLASRA